MSGLKSIPKEEHWAVVTQDERTIHHEADQRSKDAPGHGYPAYSETVTSMEYMSFATEVAALEHLEVQAKFHRDLVYRLLHVFPVSVKLRVVVEKT